MSTTTTVAPLGPFPVIKPGTFQDCNHQTGNYKLKWAANWDHTLGNDAHPSVERTRNVSPPP